MILKDDIAMHTCVDGLFLRCILQSRRIKQTWKLSFLGKLEIGN